MEHITDNVNTYDKKNNTLSTQKSRRVNIKTPPKKKRKIGSTRNNRNPPTQIDRYNEYILMGTAFFSLMSKILSLCIGDTTKDIQNAFDPDNAEIKSFEDLLKKLESEEKKIDI